jgi:hypothetical protein
MVRQRRNASARCVAEPATVPIRRLDIKPMRGISHPAMKAAERDATTPRRHDEEVTN